MRTFLKQERHELSVEVFSVEKIVFACEDVKELKKVLEADSLSDVSFARQGYVLREGKLYGLKGYVVYLKADLAQAAFFRGKLSAVPKSSELTGADREKVVAAVEEEENSAAAGFGSVFG